MKKIEAVLFDLDGTLMNTLDDLADSVNVILEKYGYDRRSREEVRKFVGNGSRKLIERVLPENVEKDRLEQILAEYVAYYEAHMEEKTRPYEGIQELLEDIQKRGIKIGVVSNKFDTAVKGLCEKYFPGKIDAAAGEREDAGIRKKPAPEMVLYTARTLGVSIENCIYVGDSEVDLLTAKNAGMDCISVCWGFRDEEFLRERGAKWMIYHPEELLEYIK